MQEERVTVEELVRLAEAAGWQKLKAEDGDFRFRTPTGRLEWINDRAVSPGFWFLGQTHKKQAE